MVGLLEEGGGALFLWRRRGPFETRSLAAAGGEAGLKWRPSQSGSWGNMPGDTSVGRGWGCRAKWGASSSGGLPNPPPPLTLQSR